MLEANIDNILTVAARIAWILFAIYTIVIFIVTLRRYGVVTALIRLFSFQVLGPLLLVLGIQLLALAIVFVQPQNVAVVVSVISPGGIRPQPLRAGLHWIVPLLENDVHYPVYWQTYTMSNQPGEGAKLGDDSIRARTSDGQEVRLDCSVIYRVDGEQAVTVHVDWQNRYANDLVRPLVRGIVRRQVSQFTVKEVNSSARRDLEAALDRILRDELNDKGFVLDQFLLRDITFTMEYASAVERKQVALEGQQQTEYEAQQMRNLADGRADSIEIEAQAQAKALRLIGEALSENRDLVTYEYVQKLSPNIRVMLVPSQSPLILPLPEMEAMGAITQTTILSPTTTMTPTVPMP